MLQRLALAITLYQDSCILILDEPTSGFDPMGRKEILEVLKMLQDKTKDLVESEEGKSENGRARSLLPSTKGIRRTARLSSELLKNSNFIAVLNLPVDLRSNQHSYKIIIDL